MTHITLPREVLEQALKALQIRDCRLHELAATALRTALEAKDVEPVATMHESADAVWYSKGWDNHEYGNDVLVTPLYDRPAPDARLVQACQLVDDLIKHQYSSTREAMTDLQIAFDAVHDALAEHKEKL